MMRDTWFGTRRKGLAPVDPLLLGALLVGLATGRLVPHHTRMCLPSISEPMDSVIVFKNGYSSNVFPGYSPPLGVPVTGTYYSGYPVASIGLEDGELYVGDQLLSAHLNGTLWTFVVLHHGTRHTAHLTIPPPPHPYDC